MVRSVARVVYWVAAGSLLAGVGTLSLIAKLWTYRERPGARWFLASMLAQTVWCLGYGVALLTFDSLPREALEALTLAAMPWTGVCYLGFSLGYTGRSDQLRSVWYRLSLSVAGAMTLLVVSNPLHGLLWREFLVTPVGGIAGATYTHEPLLFGFLALATLWVVLGTALLFDTVVSYGPLFRREAAAVGLSPLVPGVVLLLWLFEVDPVPALNFTPLAFLPHVVLDSYAFVRSDMFEFLPVTRRAGERSAVEDLGTPVFVVDTDGRVVTLNAAATDLADTTEDAALTRPLSAVLGAEVDLTAGEQRRTITADGQRREFLVTPAPLEDTGGTHVGYTLVAQDVTQSVRREQRLSVMNRVLRHNLRNDLNVVQGYLEATSERVEDDEIAEMLATATRKTTDLVRTGNKVRDIEETIVEADDRTAVDVSRLLDAVADDARGDAEAPVEVSAPEELTVQTLPSVLTLVIENLVENAVEHSSTSNRTQSGDAVEHGSTSSRPQADDAVEHGDGTVRLAADTDGDAVVLTVADDGPGIPEHELETIRAGTETDLVHGSGMGLWLVDWGVARLGGTLAFDTGESGTTVTVRLPAEP